MSCENNATRIQALITDFRTKIDELSKQGISDEIQTEVARLIVLLEQIHLLLLKIDDEPLTKWEQILKFIFLNKNNDSYEKDKTEEISSLLCYIEFAANAIFQEKPNLFLCKRIRREIEYAIRETDDYIFYSPVLNGFLKILHTSSTPLKVLFGLAIALPIYISLTFCTIKNLDAIAEKLYFVHQPGIEQQISFKEDILILALAGTAGAIGSSISIVMRIKQYDSKDYEDTFLPIIIGAVKPILGASFGILIVALVNSNLLPIKIEESTSKKEFFFFSIAFIVGFSERLALDIVSKAENSLSGSRQKDDATDKTKG